MVREKQIYLQISIHWKKKNKGPFFFLLMFPQILHLDFKIQCLNCLIYFQQLPHLQTMSWHFFLRSSEFQCFIIYLSNDNTALPSQTLGMTDVLLGILASQYCCNTQELFHSIAWIPNIHFCLLVPSISKNRIQWRLTPFLLPWV